MEKKDEAKTNGKKEILIKAGRNSVKLTNTSKKYWPEEGYTKGDLIGYYHKIAKLILPYLKNRPQSLHRHPNGIDALSFYQKDMETDQLPEWVRTEKVFSKHNNAELDYLICNDTASLLFMANLGCIEINPWHSRLRKLSYPDYMMLDLDPGDIGFEHVIETANVIHDLCESIGIPNYCKTSGATGLHIYVPLGAKYTYEEARTFAGTLAEITQKRLPKTTSVERPVAKRKNKIYIDFLQNNKGQTIAAPYSVRPRPGATVSTPLLWKEVNARLDPKKFTMFNIDKRLAKTGDLWKPILGKGILLTRALKALQKL